MQDQRNRRVGAGQLAGGDHRLLGRVGQQIGRGQAGIGVQAGDADRVVVVPLHPCRLAVRVVIGHRTRAGLVHVGHVQGARAAQKACQQGRVERCISRQRGSIGGIGFACRGDPGMRAAIADPGAVAAMQMDIGPVLGIGMQAVLAEAGTDDRRVDRQEQIAIAGADRDQSGGVGGRDRAADRQQVDELDPRRCVLVGLDDRAEVMRVVEGERGDRQAGQLAVCIAAIDHDRQAARIKQRHRFAAEQRRAAIAGFMVDLHIAAQGGRLFQVAVQAVGVFDCGDLVIVVAGQQALRVTPFRWQRHRDVFLRHAVSHRLGIGGTQQRQRVDEFAQRLAGAGVAIRVKLLDLGVIGDAVGRVIAGRREHRLAGRVVHRQAGGIQDRRPLACAGRAAGEIALDDEWHIVQVIGIAEAGAGLGQCGCSGQAQQHADSLGNRADLEF